MHKVKALVVGAVVALAVACGGAQKVTPAQRVTAALEYGACLAGCTFEAMDGGLFSPVSTGDGDAGVSEVSGDR